MRKLGIQNNHVVSKVGLFTSISIFGCRFDMLTDFQNFRQDYISKNSKLDCKLKLTKSICGPLLQNVK